MTNVKENTQLLVSKELKDVILSAISAGTFYSPQRVDGIECSDEAFKQYAGKTLSVNIVSIGNIVKAGRTTKVGNRDIGTEFDTFRCLVGLQAGESEVIKVRLHLCDLLPLLAETEAKLTFGTYYPNGEKKTEEKEKADTKYLVPTCNMRYTAEQIKESFTNKKISALVLGA